MFKSPILVSPEDYDLNIERLNYEYDLVQAAIFQQPGEGFYGPLLCSMHLIWSFDTASASCDGKYIRWNPIWWDYLPFKTRITVLAHEIRHPANLHWLRRGERDPLIWNFACVAKGTRIAMANGSYKPIQAIIPGDQILNVENGTSVVAQRINSGKKTILEIEMENGAVLRCTPEHKVLTINGFKTASQLAIGTPCFVDTRYGGVPQEKLGQDGNAADRRPLRNEVPTGRSESLYSRIDPISQADITEYINAAVIGCGMGVSGRISRWRRNYIYRQQNGERETVSETCLSYVQYLPENAGLAHTSGLFIDSSGESKGMLVLHHEYPEYSPERLFKETRAMASYEAALSNASASMDRDSRRASLQVLTNARNAVNSQKHPGMEYIRIREIRQLDAEDCFDLVTSDHHYIANGVVVHNCDIRINNDLKKKGYSFEGTRPWQVDDYGDMLEEDIYDDLVENGNFPSQEEMDAWGMALPAGSTMLGGDMTEPEDMTRQDALDNVIRAAEQAKMSGKAGDVPGEISQIIKQFLTPVVPWETELKRFMTDLCETILSWRRPNRRYTHMYMPSRMDDSNGALAHLAYYWDVSGSISDADMVRFNSEVRHIKEEFKPNKLTLIQFDTQIQDVQEFEKHEPFEDIKVTGRGGTHLLPVYDDIVERKPTAAIIFSDLFCPEMDVLPVDIPILWVVVNNPGATVKQGRILHIR